MAGRLNGRAQVRKLSISRVKSGWVGRWIPTRPGVPRKFPSVRRCSGHFLQSKRIKVKGRIVKCAKVKPTPALSYFYIEARNSGKNIRQEAFFDNQVNKVMPFLLFCSLLSDSELDPCKTFLSGTFWGEMATGS